MSKEEDKKFLELYSDSKYEKPSVTVDAVIFRLNDTEVDSYRKLPQKKLQVYLINRKFSPFKDCYAVPGTFIDLNHELSDTMKLCVKNKVGLSDFYYEQLFTFGEKARDPRTRVLSVSYMCLTNKNSVLSGGEWFDIETEKEKEEFQKTPTGHIHAQVLNINLIFKDIILKNKIAITITKSNLDENKEIKILDSELAFDHIKIIFYALERLRNKISYTDVVFNMLPTLFSLTELKLAYEEILGEKLLDANFRRKTSKMVQPTTEFVKGKGHRSSQLYKLNPNWKVLNID